KAEQDSGNIDKTRSKETLNEPNPQGTGSGSGPRCQDTMGDTIAQTRSENVSKLSNDPLLAGVNTPQSGEDSMKLKEFCTKLQQRVLDVENTKTSRAQEIASLKLRVINLGDQEDASKQGRKFNDINKDAEITLVDETQRRYGDDLMFDTSDLASEEVFVTEQGVPGSKKDDVVSTAGVAITISAAAITVKVRDKGKGKMVEPEKPMKKKELIRLDEEIASKLQAEFDEEVRLAREKAEKEEETNIVSWDNVQAMIDADYQMAQQMQAEEQEKLSIEEKSKLFVQLLEARKK
ncbi:hypothetical protein Tco_1518788, partial [Tanacetum coccineum]